MSFKTSVLIWFSRFRGTQPHPQPNGVRLLYKTEEHIFNDTGFGDRVTYEHRGIVT